MGLSIAYFKGLDVVCIWECRDLGYSGLPQG